MRRIASTDTYIGKALTLLGRDWLDAELEQVAAKIEAEDVAAADAVIAASEKAGALARTINVYFTGKKGSPNLEIQRGGATDPF